MRKETPKPKRRVWGLNIIRKRGYNKIMGKTLGYHITFTTYGTWLQGDKRGWVKDGKIFEGDCELYKNNEKRVEGKKVVLSKTERDIVRETIIRKAEEINEKILAILVWSSHVHIVIKYSGRPVEELVRIFKNAATVALKGNEFKGRVWTRGYDKRFCFDENALKARIEYVNGHGRSRTDIKKKIVRRFGG
jgi:REP element-mobilizing transposase RayT